MPTNPETSARQLAETVHGLAREKATTLPAWGDLPLSEREKVTAEARLWLRAAVDAGLVPPATNRATLRDQVAETLVPFFANFSDEEAARINAGEAAAAIEAVLPPPADRAAQSTDADDDQPETPLEKRLRHSERRNDELRAECKRRGKRVLEQSEKVIALERQLDEVRSQLGAEILRAGQAEEELRRLAAEAQPEPAAVGPSARAGLRDEIAAALYPTYGQENRNRSLSIADTVLAVLYREWPWLRAEAEDAAVPEPACTECGHPADAHQPGEDPVTPGLCTACEAEGADDLALHNYRPAAGVRQPDTETRYGIVQCSAATLNQPHGPHRWTPQPGMDQVRCPGACNCPHPDDEHSVYGCADGCACEYLPPPRRAGGAGGVADETGELRRCAMTDVVYGRCILPIPGHLDCFHERQPIRIDEETDEDSLCSVEYPGDDNFVGQLCGLPKDHFGDHRSDEPIGDGVHTVLLRWRNPERPS